MKVAPLPVILVERFHGRDEQSEIEVQFLAGGHLARPGVGADQHLVRAHLFHRATALAAVAPVLIQARLVQIEQVPPLLDVLELAAQTGVDIPDPQLVVGARGVPFPLPLRGTVAAFAAQSHHVRGDLAPQRNLQPDIAQPCGLAALERESEVDVAIALQLGAALQLQPARGAGRLPGDRAGSAAPHLRTVALPRHCRPTVRLNHQPHRLGQEFLRCAIDAVDVAREAARDARQQPRFSQSHGAAQDGELVLVHADRCVGRKHFVIQTDGRIEPAQPRVPPQLPVASVFEQLVGDASASTRPTWPALRGAQRHRAPVSPRRDFAGHVHAEPKGLHLALRHAHDFAQ